MNSKINPKLLRLYREFRKDQRKTASECYWGARSCCHTSNVAYRQGFGVTNRKGKWS